MLLFLRAVENDGAAKTCTAVQLLWRITIFIGHNEAG